MAYPQIRRILPLPQTAPQFAMPANRPAPAFPSGGMQSQSTGPSPQQRDNPMKTGMDAVKGVKNVNDLRTALMGKTPASMFAGSSSVSGSGAVAPAGGDLGYMGSHGRVLQTINSPNMVAGGETMGAPASTGTPELAGSSGRVLGGSVSPYNEAPIVTHGEVTATELPAPAAMESGSGMIGGAEGGGGEMAGLLSEGGGGSDAIGGLASEGSGMIGGAGNLGMASNAAEMYGPLMSEMGAAGSEAALAGTAAAEGAAAGSAAAGAAGAGGTAAGGVAAGSAAAAPSFGPAAWIPLIIAAAAKADEMTGGHVIEAPMTSLGNVFNGNPFSELGDTNWHANFSGYNSLFGNGGLFS